MDKLTLGGKARTLRFDMNALIDLEDHYGVPISKLKDVLTAEKSGLKDLRALVWAGLRHKLPELEQRTVGLWLSEAGFLVDADAQKVLTAHVSAAMREAGLSGGDAAKPAEAASEPNPTPESGTGPK